MSDKEFSNFSKRHRLWPSLQPHICPYTQPASSLVSVDFALRWRGSPWCLHWSRPEVTNDDQNNFCWEAARGESVSRLPPCFMGSITQDDGIGMNNAAAPCTGLEYDVRHLCARRHKREGAKVTSERSKTRLGSDATAETAACNWSSK